MATEMALNVLVYNMKRVMAIVGAAGLPEAMRAWGRPLYGQISAYRKPLVANKIDQELDSAEQKFCSRDMRRRHPRCGLAK